MNKKQFITMWCGIAAVVLAGINVIGNYGLVCFYGFFTWVLIVAVVTGGLIYSFKDRSVRKINNAIHNIRGKLLKRKQSRMKNGDYDEDKHLLHSGGHIP